MFKRVPSVKWSEVKKDDFVIDVRESHEYRAHNVKGVKNVPLSTIQNYTTDKTVYVMCQSGGRSKQAVKYLRSKGVDAINIEGGIMAYE